MKKLIAFILMMALSAPLFAAQKVEVDSPEIYQPFQLAFFPGLPNSQATSNVRGFKLGAPVTSGHGYVMGLEAGVICAITDSIYGGQASFLYCQNRFLNGAQASFISCVNLEGFYGAQATCVFCYAGDFIGIQASGACISGDAYGLQAAAVCNIAKDVTGFQASVIMNHNNSLEGFQTALVNRTRESNGMTFGLINIVDKGGIQFGFLNFNKNGFLPVCPIVNFDF